MKKGLFFLLMLAARGWALEWRLPVWTMKYELAGGVAETDAEEGVLAPSSRRSTATLVVRESADPLDLAWTVRWSLKDYLMQSGDYTYLDVVQEARLEVSDLLGLGLDAGVKRMAYPEAGAPSNDWTAIRAGLGADLSFARGTGLELGIDGRWEFRDDREQSRQLYTGSAAFTTRLGQWQLDARYRGEARLPLVPGGVAPSTALHTGSMTLRWDPNR